MTWNDVCEKQFSSTARASKKQTLIKNMITIQCPRCKVNVAILDESAFSRNPDCRMCGRDLTERYEQVSGRRLESTSQAEAGAQISEPENPDPAPQASGGQFLFWLLIIFAFVGFVVWMMMKKT
jgi:hypothetical protein